MLMSCIGQKCSENALSGLIFRESIRRKNSKAEFSLMHGGDL